METRHPLTTMLFEYYAIEQVTTRYYSCLLRIYTQSILQHDTTGWRNILAGLTIVVSRLISKQIAKILVSF